MGKISDWLNGTFGNDYLEEKIKSKGIIEIASNYEKLWIYKLALCVASERIGAIISKCEVKTYLKNESVKQDNWYLFNIEPNPNQSSCEFMKALCQQLIFKQEALIVHLNEGFFVAKDFTCDNYMIRPSVFSNVVIDLYDDEELQLDGKFSGEKAIYIKYANKGLDTILTNMAGMYADIVSNLKDIQTNQMKYALLIDQTATADPDFQEHLRQIVNEDFETFVNNENVIFPLYNGFKLDDMSKGSNSGQNAEMANKSLVNMTDEIFYKVGSAFNIPQSVMKGTYEENDMDDFLTFCIDPLADIISEGINRKYYGKKSILEGSYCRVDTSRVQHFDILNVSNAINKLISSGVYSINDIRAMLDEKPIESEFGDTHWITRNYAVVGDYMEDETNYANYADKDVTSKSNEGKEEKESEE